MQNMQMYSAMAFQLIMTYLPKLLLAIFTLIVGLWVIKILGKALIKSLDRSQVELSLKRFLASFVSVTLKILLFISIASMVGIQVTSFIAIIGAAGLAVGLALQGSLANFAGGVLILLFKPFKVGDFIDALGYAGTVKDIQIFNTILKTEDNKTIIIPNGNLSNSSITNYSVEDKRRLDMTFGIGYDDDLKKAKEILTNLIESDERILEDPAPLIAISKLAGSSVNFVVRVWVKSSDYWGVYFDMQEKVKVSFDEQGLSIH